MSTSIAQLPAYKPTKTTRTKAVVDRTIFGTTLDSHDKCNRLLNDSEVLLEAQALYAARYKKPRTATPRTQRLENAAWGIKDFQQPELAEELTRGYSSLSNYSDSSSISLQRAQSATPLGQNRTIEGKEIIKPSRASTALGFNPPIDKSFKTKAKRRPRTSSSTKSIESMENNKPTSSRRSRSNSHQHLYLPPGARNYMRIASLKITETGAKDLINSQTVNKIGLGDTLQYNYEGNKKRDRPEIYKSHGHVLQLGQQFHTDTTNQSETGPGAFYKLSSRERSFNERYQESLNGSMDGFTDKFREELALKNRRTYDIKHRKRQKESSMRTREKNNAKSNHEIPANIKHKFGAENIESLLKDKHKEVEKILNYESTDLRHSGILPARTHVPELNHPISPPVKYYSNFGQSLKYDKFEGGLHLYIK